MNKKALIVSGGSIEPSFAINTWKELSPDYIIAVDRGLEFLHREGILPTHIMGDFDSVDPEVIAYYKKEHKIPVREFDPVKDASDTEIGLRFALELGVNEVWLLGATGTRLDHVMANIQTLKIALDAGVKAFVVDPNNRISLGETKIILEKRKSFGKYFSLFPLGGIIEDLTIEGAKYPLEHYQLCPYNSRCVSNEFQEEQVVISFSEGIVILMETKDERRM